MIHSDASWCPRLQVGFVMSLNFCTMLIFNWFYNDAFQRYSFLSAAKVIEFFYCASFFEERK